MADIVLVESRRHILALTELQAATLRSLGRQLVGSKVFWRDESETGESDAPNPERTVVHCTSVHGAKYEVTVSAAVGIIALPGLQLIVQPKIPPEHFHHLLTRSPSFPRITEDRATGAESTVLWDLVATWYLSSLERLLRQGLLSDYEERNDVLPVVRGSIRLHETAVAYYQGSTLLACDFDEFTPDSALNRVLRAAALAIAQSSFVDQGLRRRARRSLVRLNEVGQLRRTDLRAALDRRTARYEAPLTLARHVLAATGRTFSAGLRRAQTFLIPTPVLVEDAVRQILREGLADIAPVRKKGLQLLGSKLTLNPDLVFDSTAVGDVKYKLVGKDWKRSDLYQAVAFATGYRVNHAAIVAFSPAPAEAPVAVQVGDVNLQAIIWDCAPTTRPHDAAGSMVRQAATWLANVTSHP